MLRTVSKVTFYIIIAYDFVAIKDQITRFPTFFASLNVNRQKEAESCNLSLNSIVRHF